MEKTRKIKVMAGLLALALVVGVLAYFSKTMSIDNPFSTKKYGGETVEKFTPKDDWEPGGKVTKEVQAKNTGDYDLYVRVKFDEKWERNNEVISGTKLSSEDSTKFFPESEDKSVTDGSSVYKHLTGVLDGTWVDGKDGYFYYKTVLSKGQTTTKILDYVTLCKDANMGEYKVSATKYALVPEGTEAEKLSDDDYIYDKVPEIGKGQVLYQKKVVSLDEDNAGLAGANYTLTITTELVQANDEAAENWAVKPTK